MVRRYAVVVPSEGEEVRIPAECLAEMGVVLGARVAVETMPGRLLLTPFWDVQAVRSDLGTIAHDLEAIRARLRRVAGLLPEAAEEPEEAVAAPALFELGADLLGTLECILADDLGSALAKLDEAVTLTLGQFEGDRPPVQTDPIP